MNPPILIDAHIHIWDLSRLTYPRLEAVPAIKVRVLRYEDGVPYWEGKPIR